MHLFPTPTKKKNSFATFLMFISMDGFTWGMFSHCASVIIYQDLKE